MALLVDSFSPRGYPTGSGAAATRIGRPRSANKRCALWTPTERLRYLRERRDVIGDRIGVQGWSNGGMTVLVTLSDHAPGISQPTPETGFRAALAEYPGCGMDAIKGRYHSYAPLLMMIASADEEVSPQVCEAFARRAKPAGNLESVVFEGAEHNFDDPGKTKQSNPANRHATEEAMRRAESFFKTHVAP